MWIVLLRDGSGGVGSIGGWRVSVENVRGLLAGLLALAGSASVAFGLAQVPIETSENPEVGATAVSAAIAGKPAGLSSWDRARLGACITWSALGGAERRSELDRRANCSAQLGLGQSGAL